MFNWIMVCVCLVGWVGSGRSADIPVVLVSVAPHQFLVEQIAQESVRSVLMVPAGASSHSYEPTPKQMQEATKAKIWFGMKEPFEAKAVSAIQLHYPHFQWIDLTEGLDLLFTNSCSCHAGADPHVWLSLRLLAQQAKVICARLAQLRPDQASSYEQRLSTLLQDMAQTDKELTIALKPLQGRILAVSHPAYGYFCRDYGLVQIAIEQEGRDPTLKQIQSLFYTLSQHKVSRILVQPQYSDKAARLLAEQLPAKLIFLDPYTSNTVAFLKELAHVLSSS